MNTDDPRDELLRSQLRALVAVPTEPADAVLVRIAPAMRRARLVHRVVVGAVATGAAIGIGSAIMMLPGPSAETTQRIDTSNPSGLEHQVDASADHDGTPSSADLEALELPTTLPHAADGAEDAAPAPGDDLPVALPEQHDDDSPDGDDGSVDAPGPTLAPTSTVPPTTAPPTTAPTAPPTTSAPTTTAPPAGTGSCAAGPQRFDIEGGSVIIACDDTSMWVVELLPDADYEGIVERGSPKKLKVRFHTRPSDHKVDHEIELELKNGRIIVNGAERL